MLDKEKLKKFLLNNFTVSHLASGGKEGVIRCPFCGDSQKKRNDAHFYIGLQEDKDTDFYQVPPKYHCFLCRIWYVPFLPRHERQGRLWVVPTGRRFLYQ